MDNVQRQRENIVLYKDKKDGADYIRIEYAGNGDISQLLVLDADVEMADNVQPTYRQPFSGYRISTTATPRTPILTTAGFM